MRDEDNIKSTVDGIVKSVAIENTTLCGADCIMCPRHNFKHKKENMDFEFFKKIIDDVVSYGVKFINFGGYGEPTIDSNYVQELKYIKTKYPHINIATNTTCHFIKGEVLDAVCEFVDEIYISVYGITKETYEKVHRGSLIYEEVKENIDNLLNQKHRPYIVAGFLVLDENKHEMDDWLSYYKDKADRCDMWRPQNWAGFLPNKDEDKAYVKCFRIDSLNGLNIRVDGSVSICCIDYNRDLILGNLKNKSFSDLINGDFVKKIQKMNDDGTIRNYSICKNCDQLRDRYDALIYSTDKNMSVGKHPLFTKEKIYSK